MPSLQDLRAHNVEYCNALTTYETDCRNFALALYGHFRNYLGANQANLWFDDPDRPTGTFPQDAPQHHPFTLMRLEDDRDFKFQLILHVDGHDICTWRFQVPFVVKLEDEQFQVTIPKQNWTWNVARIHQDSHPSFDPIFERITQTLMNEIVFNRRQAERVFGFRLEPREPVTAGIDPTALQV